MSAAHKIAALPQPVQHAGEGVPSARFPFPGNLAITAAIARGEARAAVDVETGRADLARQLETAVELKVSSKMDGSRRIIPERALLAGMLAHLDART